MSQLTTTEEEIIKKLQVGATPEQLVRERERKRLWHYPQTAEEILAIRTKAIKSGAWVDISDKKKRLKGTL